MGKGSGRKSVFPVCKLLPLHANHSYLESSRTRTVRFCGLLARFCFPPICCAIPIHPPCRVIPSHPHTRTRTRGVKPGDRYVSVICGNHKRKTAVIQGMSEFACPEVFNFLIKGAKSAVVEFLLKEKESIGNDKCLGSFKVGGGWVKGERHTG